MVRQPQTRPPASMTTNVRPATLDQRLPLPPSAQRLGQEGKQLPIVTR
jgi:hypothetical protein